MEIKYEAVFGDQALFDGFMDDCEFTDGNYGFKVANACIAYCERYNQKFGWSPIQCAKQIDVIAMRRIIRTPTWTVADQKAGKLPEVGCVVVSYLNLECKIIGIDINNNDVAIQYESTSINMINISNIRPVETPDERAKRLREEWCANAAKQLKNFEYSATLTSIYDALLSGELKMPEVRK